MLPPFREIPDMYLLNDLPPPIDPAHIARLAEAEPATIGHFRQSPLHGAGVQAAAARLSRVEITGAR
jgi:hypothetical protein